MAVPLVQGLILAAAPNEARITATHAGASCRVLLLLLLLWWLFCMHAVRLQQPAAGCICMLHAVQGVKPAVLSPLSSRHWCADAAGRKKSEADLRVQREQEDSAARAKLRAFKAQRPRVRGIAVRI